MSIQNSYDNIKDSLQNLYFNYVQQEERYSNIEHFSVSQFIKEDKNMDTRFKNDNNLPIEIKKLQNIIVPSELISVIEKFDLEPILLNDDEKRLRKKYLNIIIDQINDKYSAYKTEIMIAHPAITGLSIEEKRLVSENADSFQKLTIRIIKLLIKELEPTKCPKCPKCPKVSDHKKKESFTNVSSNGIEPRMLLLIIIVLGVLYYNSKK